MQNNINLIIVSCIIPYWYWMYSIRNMVYLNFVSFSFSRNKRTLYGAAIAARAYAAKRTGSSFITLSLVSLTLIVLVHLFLLPRFFISSITLFLSSTPRHPLGWQFLGVSPLRVTVWIVSFTILSSSWDFIFFFGLYRCSSFFFFFLFSFLHSLCFGQSVRGS